MRVWTALVRGRGVSLRTKVSDKKDGSYVVEYKPTLSGRYRITVLLHGEIVRASRTRASRAHGRYPQAPIRVLERFSLLVSTPHSRLSRILAH